LPRFPFLLRILFHVAIARCISSSLYKNTFQHLCPTLAAVRWPHSLTTAIACSSLEMSNDRIDRPPRFSDHRCECSGKRAGINQISSFCCARAKPCPPQRLPTAQTTAGYASLLFAIARRFAIMVRPARLSCFDRRRFAKRISSTCPQNPTHEPRGSLAARIHNLK